MWPRPQSQSQRIFAGLSHVLLALRSRAESTRPLNWRCPAAENRRTDLAKLRQIISRLRQDSLTVDSHALEPLAEFAYQRTYDLERHLGMKQNPVGLVAVAKPLACGLLRRCESDRASGQVKDVAVPMACHELTGQPAHQAIVPRRFGQFHRVPANLPALAATHLRSERRRQKLAAETYAEDRPVILERALD